MAGELTIPILPCPDLDEALAFYAALGFRTTYRQARPNPYAVVRREDLELHLAGIAGFDPSESYASAIVIVPDAEQLHREFAEGLKAAYGSVPRSGIPRLLRPRAKAGTVAGFTLIDVGGNWLRFYRRGEQEDQGPGPGRPTGLARVLLGAARQGDAHGDDHAAARMLDAGLLRHPEAPVTDRFAALIYRAEIALRLSDESGARQLLDAAGALEMSPAEQTAVADSRATAAELRDQLGS